MPSTYSNNLRLELIASGEQGNTWGNTTNTNLGTLLENAISGRIELNTGWVSNEITLTSYNGANDQSRQAVIVVPVATLTGAGTITIPSSALYTSSGKSYVVVNNASYAVTIKAGSTAGVVIPAGTTKSIYYNGTAFAESVTAAATLTLGGNPTTSLQAATKGYIDTLGAAKLSIDGSNNMAGELILSSGGTPSNSLAAVSKQYVSTNYLALSGGTLTGYLTLTSAAPVNAYHAVPKTYVDSATVYAGNAGIGISGTFGSNIYISLNPPSGGTIGGVKAGSGVSIAADGTISLTSTTGVTSISSTSPLLVNGTAGTPQTGIITLSLPAASTSTNGYLSSTDWNTFNNKVSTGTLSNYVLTSSLPSASVNYANSSGSCSGNAATATNASNLGGIPAASYLTSSVASSTYLPLSAGSSKPLTDYLYIGTSGNSRKTITGVFLSAGTYYPGIATYESSGSLYAPFIIVQQNNSGVVIKYNLTTAGQHNFDGNVAVTGNLSCSGTKPFRIEHPVVTDKELYHIAVESPRADLMYRGVAALENGQAVVDIDAVSRLTTGTFVAITDDAEVVGLHNKSGFGRVRATEIIDGTFTIIAEDANSTDSVAWIVVAERAGATLTGNSLVDEFGHVVPEQPKSEE